MDRMTIYLYYCQLISIYRLILVIDEENLCGLFLSYNPACKPLLNLKNLDLRTPSESQTLKPKASSESQTLKPKTPSESQKTKI